MVNSKVVGKNVICRRPTLGFSVRLIRKSAAEDIGEFQVMFRMSNDSFDGLSTRFLRYIASVDGPSIEKALHDNAFQVKFALRRSPRHPS